MHLSLTSYFLPCIWSRRPEEDKLESDRYYAFFIPIESTAPADFPSEKTAAVRYVEEKELQAESRCSQVHKEM